MVTEQPIQNKPWFRSRTAWVLLAFLAIAAFFLLTEHRAHFFSILPFALLLLCPLLHLFHHRGHGGSDGHAGHTGSQHQQLEADKEAKKP